MAAPPSSTAVPSLQSETTAPLPTTLSSAGGQHHLGVAKTSIAGPRFGGTAGEEADRRISTTSSGGGLNSNSTGAVNNFLPAPLQPNKPHRLRPQPLPRPLHKQPQPQSQQRQSPGSTSGVGRTGAGQANDAHRPSPSSSTSLNNSEGCGATNTTTAANGGPLTSLSPIINRRPSQESVNSAGSGVRRRPDGQVVSSSSSFVVQGGRQSGEGLADYVEQLRDGGSSVQTQQSAVSFVQVGSLTLLTVTCPEGGEAGLAWIRSMIARNDANRGWLEEVLPRDENEKRRTSCMVCRSLQLWNEGRRQRCCCRQTS